eukprot:g26452.t1
MPATTDTSTDPPYAAAFDLSGKAILVTGAAQGLGLAVVEYCARCGALALGLLDRQAKRLAVIRERLAERFPNTHLTAYPVDVREERACRQAVAHFAHTHQRLHGLVNAAAVNPRATLQQTTAALFQDVFEVNLLGPFFTTSEAIKQAEQLKLVRGLSIVNIASVQAGGGAPFSMAYACLKGALVTMSKNNAFEYSRAGARINAINLGWCVTENEDQLQRAAGAPVDWVQRADAMHPTGRLVRPEDAACLVGFLLSDLSHMWTGMVLPAHPEAIFGTLPPGIGTAKL